MIAFVLLAAGLSERFGSPKALAVIENQTIIERLQTKILQTSVDKIIIVLGAHHQLLEPHVFKHKKITSVYNKHYKFGQTSSIQTALKNLPVETKGFFILPVDFPMIVPLTIEALIREFNNTFDEIIIPTFGDCRGHPPLFHISFKNLILELLVSQGLNTVIHQNSSQVRCVEVNDAGVLKTFNTPEEFQKIIQEN